MAIGRRNRQSKREASRAGPAAGLRCRQEGHGRNPLAIVDIAVQALDLLIRPADVRDRNGAVPPLRQSRRMHPLVENAFAEISYNSADR